MDIINNLILMLRVYIIPLIVVLRCIYCFVKIMTDYDEKKVYEKRIRSCIFFFIVVEVIFIIEILIESYYKY